MRITAANMGPGMVVQADEATTYVVTCISHGGPGLVSVGLRPDDGDEIQVTMLSDSDVTVTNDYNEPLYTIGQSAVIDGVAGTVYSVSVTPYGDLLVSLELTGTGKMIETFYVRR